MFLVFKRARYLPSVGSRQKWQHGIFLPNLSKFRPNKCMFNDFDPVKAFNRDTIIIPLPKNDKTMVLVLRSFLGILCIINANIGYV